MQEARTANKIVVTDWFVSRARTISKLREIVRELRKNAENVRIARSSSTAACLLGAVLISSGLFAAPGTGGLSLYACYAGYIISGAGAFAKCGTQLAEHSLTKKLCNEAIEVLKTDKKNTQKLISELNASDGNIIVMDGMKLVKEGLNLGAKIGAGASIKTAANAKIIAGASASLLSHATIMIAAVVDMYDLMQDITKESRSELADQLEKVIKKLEKGLQSTFIEQPQPAQPQPTQPTKRDEQEYSDEYLEKAQGFADFGNYHPHWQDVSYGDAYF